MSALLSGLHNDGILPTWSIYIFIWEYTWTWIDPFKKWRMATPSLVSLTVAFQIASLDKGVVFFCRAICSRFKSLWLVGGF